jgi:hypothetical protein
MIVAYDLADVGKRCTAIYTGASVSECSTSPFVSIPGLVTRCVAIVSAVMAMCLQSKSFRKALVLCSQFTQPSNYGPQRDVRFELDTGMRGLPRPLLEMLKHSVASTPESQMR